MNKVIYLKDRIIEKCYEEIIEMMMEVTEETELEVMVSAKEIKILIQNLYSLYQEKEIVNQFLENMNIYFASTLDKALEDPTFPVITSEYLIDNLMNFQWMMSPIEIEPQETYQVLQKAAKKIDNIGGRKNGE